MLIHKEGELERFNLTELSPDLNFVTLEACWACSYSSSHHYYHYFPFFGVSLWHGFSTTRLTNHANNFLNTKGHARKKPQLAGYFLLRFIGSLCHEQDNRLTRDHSSHLFDAQLVVSAFLCCCGIRDIPSVPTVDLHALPSFALLRHSANFMRERGGGGIFQD